MLILTATALSPASAIGSHDANLDDASVVIVGADDAERHRIRAAAARFNDAGLSLPPLIILVHETREGCAGHLGMYHHSEPLSLIELCDLDVVDHEMAHAWEAHHVDGDVRNRFIGHIGGAAWNAAESNWASRGVEQAAQAIAWNLRGPVLTVEEANRHAELLTRYELLTGGHSPRYPHPVPDIAEPLDAAAARRWAQGYADLAGEIRG